MKATDQCRQYVAVFRVIVITRTIEIRGHKTNCIEAMLPTKSYAQLNACNCGDRVLNIFRLRRSCKQRFFLDRLLSEVWVDAAAARNQSSWSGSPSTRLNKAWSPLCGGFSETWLEPGNAPSQRTTKILTTNTKACRIDPIGSPP